MSERVHGVRVDGCDFCYTRRVRVAVSEGSMLGLRIKICRPCAEAAAEALYTEEPSPIMKRATERATKALRQLGTKLGGKGA